MATKNFTENWAKFKCNFRRGMRKVGNWMLYALGFILVALISILIWSLTIVFMNPFVLWILGFICPKWVVRETHQWCKKFSDIGLDLYWETSKGVFEHLPWYARKHYLDYAIGFDHVGKEDQMRLFNEMTEEDKLLYVGNLCSANKEFLWNNAPQFRAKLLEKETYVSRKQFEVVLNPLDKKALKAYMSSHKTLRAELLVAIRDRLDVMETTNASLSTPDANLLSDMKFLCAQLASQIELNGAPKELLADLGGCTPFVFNCVNKALDLYAHRQAVLESVKSEDKKEWKEYCEYLVKKQQQLPVSAQILMSLPLYRIYYAAGLKLDNKAIEHFICEDFGDQFGMAHEIFEHEEVTMTPELEMMLHSKPAVYRLYREAELKRMNPKL